MTVRREIRTDAGLEIGFGAGINEQDEYNINLQECSTGYNFVLDAVGTVLERRPTQDIVSTAPNAGIITGLMQLITRAGTQTQLVVAADTIYKWDGAAVWSDVTPPVFTSGGADGARLRSAPWLLDGYLVITDVDQHNPILTWDGTTCERQPVGFSIGSPVTVTTLTRSGSTATAVTASAHGYVAGDIVSVEGANETDYNTQEVIAVTDSITFTYPVSGSPSTPATGTITADKGSDVRAKHAIVHNNRMWLFNLQVDGEDFSHMCLASDFEDPTNYDNVKRAQDSSFSTGNEAFYLLSPDLKAIANVGTFYDRLVIATEDGQVFVLSGADSTDYSFEHYYSGSGAGSEEGMVGVGNDLYYFRTGKAIESLISTDRYGDIAADDLSWWIPNTVQTLENPIAVYDQTKQRVYFFDETLEGVLVLDKNYMGSQKHIQGRLSPWMHYRTEMANKFMTKAATQIRAADEITYTVYWGDSDGVIYNINGVGTAGDGGASPITMMRKTRVITELNTVDDVLLGRLEYQRSTSLDVDLIFAWLDELNQETCTLPLKEPLAIGDANYWGELEYYWNDTVDPAYWGNAQSVSDAEQRSNVGFSAVGKSSGFVLTVQISDVGTFKLARIYI